MVGSPPQRFMRTGPGQERQEDDDLTRLLPARLKAAGLPVAAFALSLPVAVRRQGEPCTASTASRATAVDGLDEPVHATFDFVPGASGSRNILAKRRRIAL